MASPEAHHPPGPGAASAQGPDQPERGDAPLRYRAGRAGADPKRMRPAAMRRGTRAPRHLRPVYEMFELPRVPCRSSPAPTSRVDRITWGDPGVTVDMVPVPIDMAIVVAHGFGVLKAIGGEHIHGTSTCLLH